MSNLTNGPSVWNVTYPETLFKVDRSDTIWSLGCILFVLSLLSVGVWCSGMCKRRDDAYGKIHYTDVPQRNRLLDILKSKAKFLPMFRRLRKRKKKIIAEEHLLKCSGNESSESDYDGDTVNVIYERNGEAKNCIIDL